MAETEVKFGEMFKRVVQEKGMTNYKLSKITGISKTHLYRIEKDTSEPSLNVLNKISNALCLDLKDYYKICTSFNSIIEYEQYLELRDLIEDKSPEIADFLDKIDISKIKKGVYLQLIYYAKGITYAVHSKNYKKSLDNCFKALDIPEILFNVSNIEKNVTSEISYTILSLIAFNYEKIGLKEKALKINDNLIKLIETNYINLIRLEMPKIIFRVYIGTLNNVSDILYNEKEYDEAIFLCKKGIDYLKKENSRFAIEYLYETLAQSLYMKGDYENSKLYFKKTKQVCELTDNFEYLERVEERIKKDYLKIL